MQIRSLSRLSYRVAGTLAMVAVFAAACGDDADEPTELRDVNNTIQLNSAAASAGTTALLNGQTFTGLNGSVLAANTVPANTSMQNQSVSISFSNIVNANGNFALTTPTFTAAGTVHFASCTFTISTTSSPSSLPVGAVITISNCSVTYKANDIPVGTSTGGEGTVTLNLGGTSSTLLDTTVEILDNGTLVVTNGLGVAIVTAVIVTGSSGG